jgi:general secretion pathway protein I
MERSERQKGFTLLEVMIGLAIVGGLLITLIYTLNYHLTLADRQLLVTNMTNLARQKMDDMRQNPLAGKGTFAEPYTQYSYETTIGDSAFPAWSEIAVTVGVGKEQITLSELIRTPQS